MLDISIKIAFGRFQATQDLQLGLTETFKPIFQAQEETKKTIDEKQDKLIEELQKNQKAITSGWEDLVLLQQIPEGQPQQVETSKLPIDYEPAIMQKPTFVDLNVGFTNAETEILTKYELPKPNVLFKMSNDDDEIIDDTIKKAGVIS